MIVPFYNIYFFYLFFIQNLPLYNGGKHQRTNVYV
jgi:hypothetical protein